MKRQPVFILKLLLAMSLTFDTAQAGGTSPANLVKSYPDFLERYDQTYLYWRDGTRMPISDGRSAKSYAEKLADPSLEDQLSTPYPKGALTHSPPENEDPGRFRNIRFFNKMYGDCEKDETQKHLVKISWLPKTSKQVLLITAVNGVDKALKAISDELDQLPPAERDFAFPSAGTFNCRRVADTGNVSMHAWGAAIDINTKYADYWLWRPHQAYRNRFPQKIVDIFEKHGFIWGGKWAHYDTMHFEYRPELLK